MRTTTAAEEQTTTAAAEMQTTTGAEVRTTTAAVAEEQTATAAEVRTATAAAEVQTTTGADTEVQTTPGAEAQLAQTTTAAAEAQLVQTATAAGDNDDNDDNDDNLEQCRIWSAARCGRHNLAMQYFGEEAHGAPTAEGTDGGGAMLDLLGVRAQMKKHFREEKQSDTGNAGSGSASSAPLRSRALRQLRATSLSLGSGSQGSLCPDAPNARNTDTRSGLKPSLMAHRFWNGCKCLLCNLMKSCRLHNGRKS